MSNRHAWWLVRPLTAHHNSTDDEFLDYIQSNYYRNTSRDAVAKVLELYPSDPGAGSPYNTGDNFTYTPQYKRMSAFQGDFIEHAPRRLFVQHLSATQPVYTYCTYTSSLFVTFTLRTLPNQ